MSFGALGALGTKFGALGTPLGGARKSANLLPNWTVAKSLVRAGTRNAKLLVIGDSTSQGIGSVTSPGTTNSTRNGYPAQLATLLNATINTSNSSWFGNNNIGSAADGLKAFTGGTGVAGATISGHFSTSVAREPCHSRHRMLSIPSIFGIRPE